MPFKIAFGGLIGSGKTTAVSLLQTKFPNLVEISFAAPMKKIAQFAYETIRQPAPEKDRRLLQYLGTEWGRNIDPNIWLKLAAYEIEKETFQGNKELVISDIRFCNELEFAKCNFWTTIYLMRSNKNTDSHISEHQLNETSGWDYVVPNNGSTDDLINSLLKIIEFESTSANL